MLGHWPAGGSLRQLYHYGQLVGTGRFRRYDFGITRNMEVYGQAVPTDYDLTKITAPMILLSGSSDPAAQSALILKVAQQLPNLVEYREIPGFTHFDFLIKIDIVRELQLDVIANANKYKTCTFCFF
jgi:pimeloyl-ACP methyl ester carboxylesterase